MNDDAMDELVALYGKAAREAPALHVDAGILRVAGRTARLNRIRQLPAAWAFGAMAASALLWVAWPHAATRPSTPAPLAIGTATPGYLDGRTRAYLLQMDVTPPPSPSARYLLAQDPLSSH